MVEHPAKPLDAVFTALADATRRALVARLARGAATVGELAQPLPMTLQAVSKHLFVLERAGLARRVRRGREQVVHLEAAPLQTVAEWVGYYQQFWENKIDALVAYLDSEPAGAAANRPAPTPSARRRKSIPRRRKSRDQG
jgi:DNA-binding transcriptional ArsR family regulator